MRRAAGPEVTPPRDGPPAEVEATDLAAVPLRRLVVAGPLVRVRLQPGDRPLVSAGDALLPGAPLLERLRDAGLVQVAAGAIEPDGAAGGAAPGPAVGREPQPGDRVDALEVTAGRLGRRGRERRAVGELLYAVDGHWRMAAGDHRQAVESPVAGIVRAVRPGIAIELALSGDGLPGAVASGEAARGRLELAGGPDAELRPGELDVGLAGTVLVVGSRVDAETLTRARAMGVRAVVAGGIGSADLRGLAASEARQRASLHELPPFAVLALEGYLRRSIASPVMVLLAALAGREVAVMTDPPLLVFDGADLALPDRDPAWIRVARGPLAGREGRWSGRAGLRRFGAGVQLEAGFVRLAPGGHPAVVPLADLQRFG